MWRLWAEDVVRLLPFSLRFSFWLLLLLWRQQQSQRYILSLVLYFSFQLREIYSTWANACCCCHCTANSCNTTAYKLLRCCIFMKIVYLYKSRYFRIMRYFDTLIIAIMDKWICSVYTTQMPQHHFPCSMKKHHLRWTHSRVWVAAEACQAIRCLALPIIDLFTAAWRAARRAMQHGTQSCQERKKRKKEEGKKSEGKTISLKAEQSEAHGSEDSHTSSLKQQQQLARLCLLIRHLIISRHCHAIHVAHCLVERTRTLLGPSTSCPPSHYISLSIFFGLLPQFVSFTMFGISYFFLFKEYILLCA